MNNISFRANLVVDNKLYNKVPDETSDGHVDDIINKYRKFLGNKHIENITKGDTIELYKAPYNKGFALGIRYISDKLDKPIEGGIYTNSKFPNIYAGNIITQTLQCIIEKEGIQRKAYESIQDAFIRALKEFYKHQ